MEIFSGKYWIPSIVIYLGYLNGSSPVMIPNSGNPSPQGTSPPTNAMNGFLQKDTLENVKVFIQLWNKTIGYGYLTCLFQINLNSSLGLFELGNGCVKAPSSPGSDSSITLNMKDVEIKQLKVQVLFKLWMVIIGYNLSNLFECLCRMSLRNRWQELPPGKKACLMQGLHARPGKTSLLRFLRSSRRHFERRRLL